MTHLKIELNNGTRETVASGVIKKLYDLAKEIELDVNGTIALKGWLYTSATYLDYITYLENISKVDDEPLLIIDATRKYIMFADPVVLLYWANSVYGDGTGIDSTSANSVQLVSPNAFNSTSVLSFDELGLFANCTTIRYDCFNHCTNLKSIDLSNITSIEGNAFVGCSNLCSTNNGVLNLPKLNSIAGGAFASCTSITEINIGSQVNNNNKITTINGFGSCSNLERITGLNMVSEVGVGAFFDCSNLKYTDLTSNVTTLDNACFSGCSSLKCIDLSGVTTFDRGSHFLSCSNLIDLSTSDYNLASSAAATYTFNWSIVPHNIFAWSNLINKSFVFPNATYIGEAAFVATKIISCSAPVATTLYYRCFLNCTNLTTVNFPSVTSLADSLVFGGCTSLTSVTLGHVTSIPAGTFYNCLLLTTVPDMSYAIGEVGASAFENCFALTQVNLSNKITVIGDDSFWDCRELTTVGDVSNVTKCIDRTFLNCKKIKSFNFTNKLTSLGSSFSGCESVTSFGDLSGLTTINGSPFNECKSMKYYVGFENSQLTLINGSMFELNTSLESITLPSTVTEIGRDAFYGDSSLVSIYVTSPNPPTINLNSFRQNNATIYVPAASLSAYLNADGWRDYVLNRIQPYLIAPSNNPPTV